MHCSGRVLFSCALLALFFVFISAQTVQANHSAENGFSGKIRLVQEDLPSPSPAMPVLKRETAYNLKGQVTRVAAYLDSAPYSEKNYQYDASGRLTLITSLSGQQSRPEVAYQYSGGELEKTICYGPDGKKLESKRTNALNTNRCSFERKDNLLLAYRKTENGQSYLCASYEYRAANASLFQKKIYRPDGTLASALLFDQWQNPVLIYQYDPQGKQLALEQIRYRVDEKGNWIEKVSNVFQDGSWQAPVTVRRTLSYY